MELKECYSYFIEYLKKDGKSQSTLLAYGKDIEQLFQVLKKSNVNSVTEFQTEHIEVFLHSLEKDGYTPKSISRKLNSIKTFCKILVSHEVIKTNPANPVAHPKVKIKEPRVLAEIEFRALRDVVRNDLRLYTIIELLLQTGIRIGELARLRLQDIDLENSRPRIFIKQYGSNDERFVPLNKTAMNALESYLKIRNSTENEALFITKTGRRLLVRNIRSSINRAFKKAGIKDAKVNDLRNTFIAHNLARGTSLLSISRIVGHKRISTTEKYLDLIKTKQGNEEKIEEL